MTARSAKRANTAWEITLRKVSVSDERFGQTPKIRRFWETASDNRLGPHESLGDS